MRESSLSLDKALVTGVLPVTGSNLLGLASCKNARPYGTGMEYVQPYESYLGLVGEFPFPQLMVSDKYQYVANATGIYSVIAGEVILKKTQAATTHYDLMDFKESIVIVGNNHTLFRYIDGELVTLPHVPEASCGCSYDGLMLLGNITSWDQSDDVDSSTVVWAARPLSSEFRLSINNVATGAGYIKLFCGPLLRIFRADKKVYVFGTQGIVVLNFISNPAPTLAVELEIACSITYRESIVRTNEGFSFIGGLGFAFGLALRETKPTKIGFQRFFRGLRTTGVYDSEEEEILFCNGTTTLTISPLGVGQRDQTITSGGLVNGSMQVVGEVNSYDFDLEVSPQNMGVAGIKTLYATAVDYETDGVVRINDSSANSLGVGTKIIAADTFRPTVKITSLTQATVSALELRWKLTDKRNVRGHYDNQTTA